MIRIPTINSNDHLFIFLLHVIAEKFDAHAILKGGMLLRLFGSSRKTLDLDYTFIPFTSKKDILTEIELLFTSLEGLQYEIKVNSKAIRVNIRLKEFRAQIEINVAESLKTEVISTAGLLDGAIPIAARVIRIMSLDVALSNKIAAWNERRLLRDLYDIYYFLDIQSVIPDWDVLNKRLANVESRIPKFKNLKTVSRAQLIQSFKFELKSLTQKRINDELEGLIDTAEIAGLHLRIKDVIGRFLNTIVLN